MATRLNQGPETGGEGAGGQRPSSPSRLFLAPSSCPSPGPHLHGPPHFLFSFCRVAQGENSAWGVGSLGFVFCLFNLMICKVMSLFLFYTFQLIFNLCLENDSCNCTFFCLLTTRINDNFVLGGCAVRVFFLSTARQAGDSGPRPWAHPAKGRHALPRAHNGPLQSSPRERAGSCPAASSSSRTFLCPQL